jgi:hypothetical protein
LVFALLLPVALIHPEVFSLVSEPVFAAELWLLVYLPLACLVFGLQASMVEQQVAPAVVAAAPVEFLLAPKVWA